MKVVLLDNIRGIGRVGDVKEVADGYARNRLLPQKLAHLATTGAVKEVESVKAKKLKVLELAEKEAAALAEKLKDTAVTLTGKANDQGTLFAGIEAHHIAEAVSQKANVSLDPSSIELSEHIKSIGEYTIPINLPGDITTSVALTVTPA